MWLVLGKHSLPNNKKRFTKMKISPPLKIITKYANLSLLIIFPISWFAPLIERDLLTNGVRDFLNNELSASGFLNEVGIFNVDVISVASGLQKLWQTDLYLAFLVTFFALFAPMIKCLGMALIDFGLLSMKVKKFVGIMGKLAMADIFIMSLYVVIIKGIGIGEIKISWGLYLFSAAVIFSMLISLMGSSTETQVGGKNA